MSTEETNIEKRLRDWLESQGYPLEMLVAVAFQHEGFHAIQSEYYADPETGVMREVDVYAHVQRSVAGILFRISFVVECKLSRDKPWVMFTSRETALADPARVAQRAASVLGRQLLRKVGKRGDLQGHVLFQTGARPAYGLTQAFTTGQDIPYAAITSVAKATLAKTIEADYASEIQVPACEIVFPVIVIDSRLFECYLEKSESISVSEISSGTLVWRNPLVKMPHSIIHVVTVSALDKYIKEARSGADLLLTSCDSELSNLPLAKEMKEQISNRRQLKA